MVGWPRRISGYFPGESLRPGAFHGMGSYHLSYVVNEMVARINERSVYSQGYADDICLLAAGKFPNMVSGFI